MKKKLDPETLRKAQLIMLDSLIEFDGICKKHNLKYWLDSGTLLGAVRHKGFIPWDDDIDISMPVEDYQKFLELAKKELPQGMFLQTKQSDPLFPFDYMKIRSDRASIIEFHEKDKDIKYHQGVFVDIFPMFVIKDTKFNRLLYKNAFKAIRFFSAKNFDNIKIRKLIKKSIQRLHLGWDKSVDTSVIYSGKMPDVAAVFKYDAVFPLKKIDFEGLEFYAPNDPHHYLESIYSFDYMELPPMDKRATHAEDIIIHS
jgi:lipopolysaccharide cholinephosphotransferase